MPDSAGTLFAKKMLDQFPDRADFTREEVSNLIAGAVDATLDTLRTALTSKDEQEEE